jgi:manganese/iron transport system ATP-binding protein
MDEPFTGVDASTQEITLRLLEDLKKQQVTVLVSTHDLNMASQRFETVLLLNHKLVAYGPAAKVFTQANLSEAFSGQVILIGGALVVDQCCGAEEHEHIHAEGG